MTAALADKQPEDNEYADEADAALEKDPGAFRTIGEAAGSLGLKPHVLRFWETKFDNLTPLKRADGRRYYGPEDMDFLRTLQDLLHVQGLTIRGAVKALEERDADHEPHAKAANGPDPTGASVRDLQDTVRSAVERGAFRSESVSVNEEARAKLERLLEDLTNLKSRLDVVRQVA